MFYALAREKLPLKRPLAGQKLMAIRLSPVLLVLRILFQEVSCIHEPFLRESPHFFVNGKTPFTLSF